MKIKKKSAKERLYEIQKRNIAVLNNLNLKYLGYARFSSYFLNN